MGGGEQILNQLKWKTKAEKENERAEVDQEKNRREQLPDTVEKLGQALTDSEIIAMHQGQTITDLELKVLMMEAKLNESNV
jgi:predicted Rossmann fold nucleotide-binding protein DprA/Smf involved in DNA uptake